MDISQLELNLLSECIKQLSYYERGENYKYDLNRFAQDTEGKLIWGENFKTMREMINIFKEHHGYNT